MQTLAGVSRRLVWLTLFAAISVALVACGGAGDDGSSGATPGTGGAIATATDVPDAEATSTPASTPLGPATPTATPSGSVVSEVGYHGYQIFGDFEYAEPVAFPEDLMMLVETGCTQCDSGPDALYRVWRNDGETHVDLLIDATVSGIEGAELTSIAVRPTLHDIVVTVCNECGERPLTSSSITVYRSIDGGVTWRSIMTTERGDVVYARAVTDEGIVLEDFGGGLSYLHGDAIEPPQGAESLLLPDTKRAGELRWLAESGSTVLDARGNPIAIVEPGSRISTVAPDKTYIERPAVGWGLDLVDGPFEGWVVTRPGPDGRLVGFRSDTYVAPVAVLGGGLVLGIMSTQDSPSGGTIGYIDASRGSLTPIHGPLIEAPFGDGIRAIGRNDPQGAVAGPFFRVDSGVNCLPIRSDTGSRGRELTCAADGTLLYDLHSTVVVGAQEWAHVGLLDGREGYTVTRYLSGE